LTRGPLASPCSTSFLPPSQTLGSPLIHLLLTASASAEHSPSRAFAPGTSSRALTVTPQVFN
jgi:hypothetical protein